MKIWKGKWNFAKQKRKWNFFGGSGNENGTAFFNGTNTKMEFLSLTDAEFLFSSGFARSI
jgi:hypothetical protein